MFDKKVIIRSNTYEGQRSHFIERVKERYSLDISTKEYDLMCCEKGFHGVFGKRASKTIGWVMIKGIKLWVLRDGVMGRLSTCYPPNVEHDDIAMIRACFSGSSKNVAFTVYQLYLREAVRVRKKKFDSQKDAALYIFTKTKFAQLHMEYYKHKIVRPVKMCLVIDGILRDKSDYVELFVRKKIVKK